MLIPTTAEQREDLYEDIEGLIFPGFLAHDAALFGINLSFRSFFPSDNFLLQHRIGPQGTDYDWKIWCVASCVWMVNGQILLEDANATFQMAKHFRTLPTRTLGILFSLVVGLVQRVNRAFEGVEAFCYEDTSRSLWKQVGRQFPNSDYVNGIPGVGRLGMNHLQRMWLTYNQTEDDRFREMLDWQTGKMIASASSPKGIERLNKQDQLHWSEEEQRRQEVVDTFFYRRAGKLSDDQSVTDFKARKGKFRKAQTTDDLAAEMKRWVSGEMDEHDQIVAEYKGRIMQQREEEIRKRQESLVLAQKTAVEFGEDPGPLRLIGYTPDQLQEILKDKLPVKPGVRKIHDDVWGRKELLYNKYLSKGVEAGHLVATPDGDLVVNQRSLNDQIAQRRVQVDSRMDPHRK